MLPKEAEIINIKTVQTIKDAKTNYQKKITKKKSKFGKSKQYGFQSIANVSTKSE